MNTKVNRILWPAILFIVLVALWALAVRVFDVKAYILPSPSDVLDVFVTESQTLKSATLATAAAAMRKLLDEFKSNGGKGKGGSDSNS